MIEYLAQRLRAQLGAAASKVPTRALPDLVLRLMSVSDPALRAMTPRLGREHRHSIHQSSKHFGLAWRRPAAETLVDCARSLLIGTVS